MQEANIPHVTASISVDEQGKQAYPSKEYYKLFDDLLIQIAQINAEIKKIKKRLDDGGL